MELNKEQSAELGEIVRLWREAAEHGYATAQTNMGQCYYKEGKLEGEFKLWYENGQLWFQEYYKEGKLDGEYKRWGINGQLMAQTYYKEGIPIKDLILGIDIF